MADFISCDARGKVKHVDLDGYDAMVRSDMHSLKRSHVPALGRVNISSSVGQRGEETRSTLMLGQAPASLIAEENLIKNEHVINEKRSIGEKSQASRRLHSEEGAPLAGFSW
jgi:hypothetical protein